MPIQSFTKITSIYEKLREKNDQALNWFCRKYCVRCAISQRPDGKKRESQATLLHLIAWKDDKLAMQFMHHMETYSRNPWLLEADLKGLRNERPTYLFIDGSNISAAVKNRFHILFDYRTILDVVSFESPNVVHKEVVESFLSHHVDKREAMWDELGVIPTILPVRPGEKEEIVDELLHEAILDQMQFASTPGHLVLLSGDGNWNLHPKKNQYNDGEDSEGEHSESEDDDSLQEPPSSFPKVIDMALQYGWSVDVWSMKHSCSKTWVKFQETYSGKFRLQYINSLLRQCVFPMDFDEAKSLSILAKKRAGHMESILFHPDSFA